MRYKVGPNTRLTLLQEVLDIQLMECLAEALVEKADRAQSPNLRPYHLIDYLAQRDGLFAELVRDIYMKRRIAALSASEKQEEEDYENLPF